MNFENTIEKMQSSPSSFVETALNRSVEENTTEKVLDHDGNAVLISENYEEDDTARYRALYEATVHDDTEVFFVTQTHEEAKGTILLMEDAIRASPFPESVWGLERQTNTEMVFDNGSRIAAKSCGRGAKTIRGYHPDLLVIDDWMSGDGSFEGGARKEMSAMVGNTGTTAWLRTDSAAGPIFERLIDEGVLVHPVDNGS